MADLTIREAQKDVAEFIESKGWDNQPLSVDITFMAEELGEVAREALRLEVPRKDKKTKAEILTKIGEELADQFYWTLKVCDRLGLDLDKEFARKLKITKSRKSF